MNDWQMNLTKSLQKADPYGKVTKAEAAREEESSNHNPHGHDGGIKETDM